MAVEDRVLIIRRWLMMGQKPDRIVATNAANECTTVSFRFGDTWIALARTLDAVDPIRLQAFDVEGVLLRATTLTALENVQPEDLQEDRGSVELVRAGGLSTNEQLLCTFGKLLANAYEGANVRMAEGFINKAWVSLTDLFNSVVQQNEAQAKALASLERSLLKVSELLQHAYESDVERTAADQPTLVDQMVQSYIAGQAQSQATGAAPANGKGTKGNQI